MTVSVLEADDLRECLYMNVVGREVYDAKCANCGAPKPETSE
jgi:hypothetical protein